MCGAMCGATKTNNAVTTATCELSSRPVSDAYFNEPVCCVYRDYRRYMHLKTHYTQHTPPHAACYVCEVFRATEAGEMKTFVQMCATTGCSTSTCIMEYLCGVQ